MRRTSFKNNVPAALNRTPRGSRSNSGNPISRLQILDLPRQGRLRDMKARSRSSEMLLLSNGDEIAQMPEFHLIPSRYWTDKNKILDLSVGLSQTRGQS